MFRKKSHDEPTTEPADDQLLTIDHFRAEAEEHAERAERARLEHRAQELGVTVAQLQAALPIIEAPIDAHDRESIRESEKAAHARHR